MATSENTHPSLDRLLGEMSEQLKSLLRSVEDIKQDIKNKVDNFSFNELRIDFENHKKETTDILKDYTERRANLKGMIILISVSGFAIFALIAFSFKLYIESLKTEIAATASSQMLQTLQSKYEINIK